MKSSEHNGSGNSLCFMFRVVVCVAPQHVIVCVTLSAELNRFVKVMSLGCSGSFAYTISMPHVPAMSWTSLVRAMSQL